MKKQVTKTVQVELPIELINEINEIKSNLVKMFATRFTKSSQVIAATDLYSVFQGCYDEASFSREPAMREICRIGFGRFIAEMKLHFKHCRRAGGLHFYLTLKGA